MKGIRWYLRRNKARKTGCYNPDESYKIKLDMTDEQIKKFCKKLNLKEVSVEKEEDLDFLKGHLQGLVYLGLLPNREEALRNEICRYEEHLQDSFPKLFWEEYVTEQTRNCKTHSEVRSTIKYFDRIKRKLDRNKELQGITGRTAQDMDLTNLTGDKMFSWRAWGALMAAYMNTKKGQRLYDYMSYYM